MANNCDFEMNIAGEKAAVNEFVQMLKWEGPFEEQGLGRIYDFDEIEVKTLAKVNDKELISLQGGGDCAWSVLTAMMQEYRKDFPSLESETKRLGLALEVWSSESGCTFQEHYIIDKGNVLVDECVTYIEYWPDCMDEEEIEALCKQEGISKEAFEEIIDRDGFYGAGGFGDDYGCFEDLSEYVRESIISLYSFKNQFGNNYTVTPVINRYTSNENIYLGLHYLDKEFNDYLPFCDVTVNIDNLPYLEAAIDVPNVGPEIMEFLEENKMAEPTGKIAASGFCVYPIYKFNEDFIRSINETELKAHAKEKGVNLDKAPLSQMIDTAKAKSSEKAEGTKEKSEEISR